jgi:N-acyl-D-amino-acid deacylase
MAASGHTLHAAGKRHVRSRTLMITAAVITWASSLAMTRAESVEPEFDIVLRNGRIVDGTGNPAIHADLAIKERKVAAIGRIGARGMQEYDATGLVIAPGFIDVHTHAEDIDDQPLGENFLHMGVTTLMLGNCGASALNIGEYFQKLEELTVSPNIATLVGHGTVRRRAMHGSFDRPPTDQEMAQMKAFVRQGMDEGAFGISTGLIYLPSVFAKTEEIIELAKVVSEYDGIYATHQRSESNEIFKSLDEIFRIAREGHVRGEISHLKLSGPANWGKAGQVIAAIERARAEGLDITQDQYAYTASSTGLSQLIPEKVREGGREKFMERLNDPETKAGVVEEMKKSLQKRQSPDFSYAVIAGFKLDPTYNGLNVVEATGKLWGADSIEDQIETILEIEKHGGASAVFHGMSEADLEVFMKHPNTMFASDSGVRRYQQDVPHPRGYGNAARILGQYVREKKVLRLEDAIRRMTSLPARTFRIKDRGELREGAWADIVVFAPELVSDPSTYKDPHHYATGMKYVFVNGALVVENDRHNGARPGMILRHEPVTKPQVKAEPGAAPAPAANAGE